MTAQAWIARGLNRLLGRHAGAQRRPAFFDIDRTYPSLRLLDRSFEIVRGEMLALLHERERIPRYHELSSKETYISGSVDKEKAWRVFMLKWPGGGVEANRARCPRTAALLDRIPGVLCAFFSILEAGKSVPAHDGPYLGYLRYHLALKVPVVDPPSIRVKDTVYTWVEQGSVLFDDSWNHEVYNRSNDIRVVLIVDVMRPMSLPYHALNWFVLKILGPASDEARQAAANIRKYSQRSVTDGPFLRDLKDAVGAERPDAADLTRPT